MNIKRQRAIDRTARRKEPMIPRHHYFGDTPSVPKYKTEKIPFPDIKTDTMSFITWDKLPGQIQQRMLEEQEAQSGFREPDAFRESLVVGAGIGFTWSDSKEGNPFWSNILSGGEISHFYTKYPKQDIIVDLNPTPTNPLKRFKTKEEFEILYGENWRADSARGTLFSCSLSENLFGRKLVEVPWKERRQVKINDETLFTESTIEEFQEKYKVQIADRKERERLTEEVSKLLTINNVEVGESIIFECKYNYKGNYFAKFKIVHNPTGNCQFVSIVHFDNLLSSVQDDNKLKIILKIAYKRFEKKMIFFDVHKKYDERINKLFSLNWSNDYVSTNNSKMYCGMILCDKL